jgi:hypothetical protein
MRPLFIRQIEKITSSGLEPTTFRLVAQCLYRVSLANKKLI